MNFDEIIGNEEIKKYLFNSSKSKQMSQSYLFVGKEGIGKLLIAKAFAKKILCLEQTKNDSCVCKSCKCFEGLNHTDFSVINEAGETIKIDQIREITNKVIEQPIISNKKVYLINDCDKMTIEAQNCLLKTLEEPPEFVVMILITSNENAILNTIKSRCMTIKFKDISKEELQKYVNTKFENLPMTEKFLKFCDGSIGKMILQKENQEKFLKIESIINDLAIQDVITLMNEAKAIYDKESIYMILEYMIMSCYEKSKEDKRYVDCIEKINHCTMRLRRNCNFDMSVDTMLLEMWESIQKGK